MFRSIVIVFLGIIFICCVSSAEHVCDRPNLTLDELRAFASRSRTKNAIPCFERILQLDSNDAGAHAAVGEHYSQSGDNRNALHHLLKAKEIVGRYSGQEDNENLRNLIANVHYQLGTVYYHTGQYHESIPALSISVKHAPGNIAVLNQLGIALQNSGDIPRAIKTYKRGLRVDISCTACAVNLGLCFEIQQEWESALAVYRSAIQYCPEGERTCAQAYVRLGELLVRLGRIQDAVNILKKGSESYPRESSVWIAYGNAIDAMHDPALHPQLQDAYANAVSADPDSVPAIVNLARAIRMRGNTKDAITLLEGAIMRFPSDATLHVTLADAFKDGNDLDQSIREYEHGLAIRGEADAHLLCNMIFALQTACHWSHPVYNATALWQMVQREQLTNPNMRTFHCVMPIQAMLYPFNPSQLQQISRAYAASNEHRIQTLGIPPINANPPLRKGERLRIGYISTDIKQHPLSYLMRSVFSMIDRTKIEVWLFAASPTDGSALRSEISRSVEHFIDISSYPTEQAARVIAAAKIHILVDLNGHTQGGRFDIITLKPAPVVISYMGFCGTQGSPHNIHYLAVDKITTPPSFARHFDERLIFMPDCYFVNDHKQRFATLPQPPSRSSIGLPEKDSDQVVFCSFASLPKLDRETVELWSSILARVPNSVMWLLKWPHECLPRVLDIAEHHGVSRDRFVFSDATDFERHLGRIQLCDIHLDTLHVTTHTVACDVLWAAVPSMITPGATIASRVSASIASALGVEGLVAASAAELEENAVRLGNDRTQLAVLKNEIEMVCKR